jgi:short-subunit dehydrogenase
VNCAGVGLYASACDGDTAAVKRLFDINLFAALEMVRLIRPHLKAARDATVVNVGSVGGYVSLPWSTMYCASKGALHCLSDGLRRELRPQGIRVISVVPGVITTEFRDRALGGTKPPDGVFRSVHYAISAARMAECIVRGIEKDRKEVVAPWTARGFRLVNSLFPGMVDWYCTRICPPHRRNA